MNNIRERAEKWEDLKHVGMYQGRVANEIVADRARLLAHVDELLEAIKLQDLDPEFVKDMEAF